jgi:DNA-binding Lrp family transcriptional regulator
VAKKTKPDDQADAAANSVLDWGAKLGSRAFDNSFLVDPKITENLSNMQRHTCHFHRFNVHNDDMTLQNDETDSNLLALLRRNARASVAELSRKLALSRTTVQARIERLERTGRITGYTVREPNSARAPLTATVLIQIEPRSAPAVLARLDSLPGVAIVHTTSGRFDLLAQISAQTTQELDDTIDRIGEARGVKSSESLIHLSTKIDRIAT